MAAMSFTTDEVNLLVHRYLVESGYSHAAFTFYTEGGLDRTNLRAADVPPGALVAYLQKGLEYVSIEEHINEVRILFWGVWRWSPVGLARQPTHPSTHALRTQIAPQHTTLK